MKRRDFFIFTLLSYSSFAFAKNSQNNELLLIKSVLEHMFPNTKRYNGAKRFKGYEYLLKASKHKSFDKSDMRFLLKGAKELLRYDRNFTQVSTKRKEKLLRKFENTKLGANWLSLLLYYGFEAMLCDPIYGGNKDMSGWKNINHTPPVPMAKVPYGKAV